MAIRSNESIASAAAILCGLAPISDLTTNSRESQVLNGLLDFTLDALVSATTWNFAIEELVLSKLITAPTDTRYAYAYQLPLDFNEAIVVYDTGGTHGYDYVIQKDQLLTNLDGALLKYKKEISVIDVPGYFVDALVFQLAANAAEGLTGITSLSNKLATEAAQKRRDAIIADGRNMAPQTYWVKSTATRIRK